MVSNKFFFVFFSILLIFPIFVNADEDCIFDYVKVEGHAICKQNCSESFVISKERVNLILTPKPNITIKYYPTPQYNQQPNEKWINNSLHIIQPITSNYGYYYWIFVIGKPEKLLRLIILSYDEYENKCVKKEGASQSQDKTNTQSPPEQGNKTQSNESQKEDKSSKEEVKTIWNFWNLLQFIYNNWEFIAIIFFVFIVVLAVIIARSRGATWEQISLGFLRETSQIPIPEKHKIKKSKPKKQKPKS